MSNKKTAMVGTPCQILAATKINRYEEKTGGSPIDVKIGCFVWKTSHTNILKDI